jgi:glycosyltransferase involved in cell wall biosynthesis
MKTDLMNCVALIGSAGIPAKYGGFETLAEQLGLRLAQKGVRVVVYCSTRGAGSDIHGPYRGMERVFFNLNPNGVSSIVYDAVSTVHALLKAPHGSTLIFLGTSGALGLLLTPFRPDIRTVVNVDGLEWRRSKWSPSTRLVLRFFEWLAVRLADHVIADNAALATEVRTTYGFEPIVIAYGGDHLPSPDSAAVPADWQLPISWLGRYFLSINRIEPENNIELILRAAAASGSPFVMVGNWDISSYGRNLYVRYSKHGGLKLLPAIYDPNVIAYYRANALAYVHGHSVGGTNPTLVEALWFDLPILAYDCSFNRATLNNQGNYFSSVDALVRLLNTEHSSLSESRGSSIRLAREHYSWDVIVDQYFRVLAGD